MAWTTPTLVVTGAIYPASQHNTDVIANLIALFAGAMGLTSQAVGDLLYASSTTQWARIAAVTAGSMLRSAGTGTAPAWSTDASLLTALNGAAIATGQIPVARMGTGTPTATTTLLGNGTWGNVGVKTVQYGFISVVNGVSSGTATVSAVVVGKTQLSHLGFIGLDEADGGRVSMTLTNTTTVTAFYNDDTHGIGVVRFCLTEFW